MHLFPKALRKKNWRNLTGITNSFSRWKNSGRIFQRRYGWRQSSSKFSTIGGSLCTKNSTLEFCVYEQQPVVVIAVPNKLWGYFKFSVQFFFSIRASFENSPSANHEKVSIIYAYVFTHLLFVTSYLSESIIIVSLVCTIIICTSIIDHRNTTLDLIIEKGYRAK